MTKNIKLILSLLLAIVSLSQYLIWGFLVETTFWAVYSVIYLIVCIWQRFHQSSLRLNGISFCYVLIPLVILIAYEISQGFSKLTFWFYIIFMISLSLACAWETVVLIFTVRETLDEKKERK